MMGRGRTHHHVAKQKSEDQSRRPIIAMGYFFMRMESAPNVQEQGVICFDDITGKELPWHEVRKVRELELKYLRDLGVYEKVDEKEAVGKYGISSRHEMG